MAACTTVVVDGDPDRPPEATLMSEQGHLSSGGRADEPSSPSSSPRGLEALETLETASAGRGRIEDPILYV